jgi:integrase
MSGHIRRRGERSWELKYDAGRHPLTGKRQIRYVSFKGTKREAQAELVKLMHSVNTGTDVDPTKISLSEFCDRWVRDWASTNVSAKTFERYGQLVTNQIKPHIGAMQIQKLRPVHLQELYAKLLRSGGIDGGPLSARTVGHSHRLIRRILGHAVTWGMMANNPAAAVSPPRVPHSEIEIASDAEIKRVLDRLRERDRPLYVIAVLALATGMRRGEILALRWSDVEDGWIRIERSLAQTRAGLKFKLPKSKNSRRTVTIPASVAAELRAHKTSQQELRLKLGMGRGSPDDLVFPARDGSPWKPNGLTNGWLRATMAVAVGRRISFHSLRHLHVSNLIAAGVDILTVSRRVGHASAAITLSVYGHLVPNADDRAAQAIEAMFARVGME